MSYFYLQCNFIAGVRLHMLSRSDTEMVLRNEYVLEFIEATVTQQKDLNPKVYKGSASITQTKEGQLRLKMYSKHTSSDDFLWGLTTPCFEPGKLLGPEDYFTFEGADFSGAVWKADGFRVEERASAPVCGSIIQASLRNVSQVTELKNKTARRVSTQVVPGKYRIPFNLGQEDNSEPGFSACFIDLGEGKTCSIKTMKGAILIIINYQNEDPEKYPARVLDAIGFSCGAHLSPQVEVTEAEGKLISVVQSFNIKASEHHRVSPPVDFDLSQMEHFSQLVRAVVTYDGDGYSQLMGLWYRVLTGFDSGLENAALVLTTAIEGVLKTGFPDEGRPDQSFIDEIKDAKPKIKAIKDLMARARDRIMNSLGSATNPTPKNALRALVVSGKIDAVMPGLWSDLRNKTAHADELKFTAEQAQVFVDQLHGCLELFYRLIFVLVGYEGLVTQYSKRGWPEANLVVPKGIPTELEATGLGTAVGSQ